MKDVTEFTTDDLALAHDVCLAMKEFWIYQAKEAKGIHGLVSKQFLEAFEASKAFEHAENSLKKVVELWKAL